MLVPVKITNEYVKIKDKAVKTMQIAIKGSVELGPGDFIVLNPQNPKMIEIKRIPSLSPVFPYPNN